MDCSYIKRFVEAMIAQKEAVIRSIDDDGVFGEVLLIQIVEQPAHIASMAATQRR